MCCEWKEIASAPKDGTEVLTCCRDGSIRIDFYDQHDPVGIHWLGQPTHWMPLPETPKGDNV
jgi:hypothetical protein